MSLERLLYTRIGKINKLVVVLKVKMQQQKIVT